ncbi:MAG: glycosyltransferase family protein [bacterium]
MKTTAIIQARLGSTRLPGKVIMDVYGETMLARVVRRTLKAKMLDEVVVATTDLRQDDPIVAEAHRLGVMVFRGSETNVLDRYYQAAQTYHADVIVRITSDCPLIDPEIVDLVIWRFLKDKADYASNVLRRTYPRGLDTEVMTNEALTSAWRQATETFQQEHVTPYLYQNPHQFRLLSVTAEKDYTQHRWCVDTIEDLDFVRQVYSLLGHNGYFGWQKVLSIVDKKPELLQINRQIRQKEVTEA